MNYIGMFGNANLSNEFDWKKIKLLKNDLKPNWNQDNK